MSKIIAILAVATAAICATGCKKATDDKPGVTHTTSAELPSNTTVAPPEPAKDDYLATVHREQLALSARIDDHLGTIDRQVSDLRRAGRMGTPEAQELLARRQTLEADSAVVARSDERGWDELKATVEHDLGE